MRQRSCAPEHLDVGALLVDEELRPVVVNRALRRLHGDDGPPPPDGVRPGRPELRLPDGRPLPPGPGLFGRVLREGETDAGLLGVRDVTADALHVVRVHGRRSTGAAGEVAGVLLTAVDVCDRVDQEEQLRRLAEHDELTGVLDRRGLARAARAALVTDGATRFVHVVVVDGLEAVDDHHGHAEGDRLLRAVAEALAEVAGPDGVVARTGGDEFAVVCGRADLAPRLEHPLRPAGRRAGLLDVPSVSVGTVEASGPDLEALLAQADAAMYGSRRTRRWSTAE